ncbi:MAG: hypothetical protein WKG03_00105 [Telluria sp.]
MAKHGTKAKRNKKYSPKGINPNAAFQVVRDNWRATFSGTQEQAANALLREKFAQPVGDEQREDLSFEYRSALVALMAGNGGVSDWDTVTSALNTGLVLCERGFGNEYEAAMVKALDQVFAVRLHHDRTGAWVFSAEAIDAINEGIDVHDAQLEHAMQADVLSALAEVAKRIESQQVYKEAA